MYPQRQQTDIDVQRLSISVPLPIVKRKRPPRHKGGELFLRGPIPMAWLARANQLPGGALFVGLVVWHLAGIQKNCAVKWQPKRARQFGLSRKVTYRALVALELAKLVTVERRPGQAHTITIQHC
jgi:hypothetical protein